MDGGVLVLMDWVVTTLYCTYIPHLEVDNSNRIHKRGRLISLELGASG